MKILISLFLLFVYNIAHAESPWFALGSLSYHQDRDANYNERNAGFGLEFPFSETTALAVGFYNNSIRQHTNYALYQWTPWQLGTFKFGGMVGVADGYYANDGGIVPVILPLVKIEGKHIGANLTFIPNMANMSAVAAIQFKIRF